MLLVLQSLPPPSHLRDGSACPGSRTSSSGHLSGSTVFGFWFLGTPSHLGTKQYTIPRVGESNPFMEPTTPNQPAATSASAWDGSKKIDHKDFMQFVSTLRKSAMSPDTIESLQRLLMDDVGLSPGRRSCKSFGTSQPALNCADITADAVAAPWGDINLLLIATPVISSRNRGRLNFWLASSPHLRLLTWCATCGIPYPLRGCS